MSTLRVLAAALFLSTSPLALGGGQAQAQSSSVSVKVGGRQSVTVSNIDRVVVADPDVADIRVGGDRVEITGRAAGSTQLMVWRQDGQRVSYQINVSR